MTKQEAISYWKNHIHQSEQFEGSVPEYCRSAGIRDYTFYYWRSKLRKSVFSPSRVKTAFIRAQVDVAPKEIKRLTLPDPEWLASFILHLQDGVK